MTSEPGDIDDVRRQEQGRGRRPIDIAARRRRLILQRKFKEALDNSDVELFKEALISDLGQLPGTKEYDRSLKLWYAYHGRS